NHLQECFACEAPSSPQCFRRKAEATVYTCEWSMNTTQSDMTETKFGNIKETFHNVVEEQLIQSRSVMIWVEAHIGNSTCKSPKTSVILQDIVKYEAPQNISASWLKNNLSLSWIATEKYPAVAEVWFRRDEHPTEPWGKVSQCFVTRCKFLSSAYQVQIRHRSTMVKKPLWSAWSQVVVPAVCLSLFPLFMKRLRFYSHSSMFMPPCFQNDGIKNTVDQSSLCVSVTDLKDYIRYLYFEHRCQHGRPQTVKMCFFYQKEGGKCFHENISADLSWKAIPLAYQQGFLTHYRLCWVKISSQDEPEACDNIPASETRYHLENLKAGSKYNITLAGVTQVGEGPEATAIINTKPGKPMNDVSLNCLRKIKVKIFPPVPKPEVHDELTLLKLYPEGKSVSEEAEDVRVLRDEWDDGTDEDVDHDRSTLEECSDDCSSPGSTDEEQRNSKGEITDLEQVDNELAMLIYKNGLVFDMKTELP
uniref:Fibronectin type-III domain-containing protein n=1 Tax=Astatotilapia calliptera TaxID=8154 RepID=A0AAX7VWF2_ASTCA